MRKCESSTADYYELFAMPAAAAAADPGWVGFTALLQL
jgi:hypothetical protein